MTEAARKRFPEYHDMFINNINFKLRGYIEVIENELNTVINIINSNKKRHLNLFRSLEGILYFFLHNIYNIKLKDLFSLDSQKLNDLILLFSSLWLYTLTGLSERKQLNERTLENLNIVLIELFNLYKELNLLFKKSFEDIHKRLLILIDDHSIISNELKLEIINRANLETSVLDEKWDINNQLTEWNNKYNNIFGGEEYNLTKWSYAKRYPYLLSTRSITSVQPPSPTAGRASLPVSPKSPPARSSAAKRPADVALTPPTSKRLHVQEQDLAPQQHSLTTQWAVSAISPSVETVPVATINSSSVYSMPPSSHLSSSLLNYAAPLSVVDVPVYGGPVGITTRVPAQTLLPLQSISQNIARLHQFPPAPLYSPYQQQQQLLLPAQQEVTNVSSSPTEVPILYSLYNPDKYSLFPRQQLVSAEMLSSIPPVSPRRPIRPIPHVPIRKGPFLQQLVPHVASSSLYNLESRNQLLLPMSISSSLMSSSSTNTNTTMPSSH